MTGMTGDRAFSHMPRNARGSEDAVGWPRAEIRPGAAAAAANYEISGHLQGLETLLIALGALQPPTPHQEKATHQETEEPLRQGNGGTAAPAEGEPARPTNGRAAAPAEGEAARPPNGGGIAPAEGEPARPSNGGAAAPAEGEAAKPSNGGAAAPPEGEAARQPKGEASPQPGGEAMRADRTDRTDQAQRDRAAAPQAGPQAAPQAGPQAGPVSTETDRPSDAMNGDERAFSFIPRNARDAKPRRRGMTEIRGPYYSAMGERYLADVLETMGEYVDGLKFAGGSFALMPKPRLKALLDLAHAHGVYVSTGGWVEHVLTHGPQAVERYFAECAEVGFDVVELSVGFISLPPEDLIKLVKGVTKAGLKAKPELGIQFGAGGGETSAEALAAEGSRDVQWVIDLGKRCLDAGADIIMIESEGITENVSTWRTDVSAKIINGLGLENVMFEAAEPPVFEWYVKNYGLHVNLFVDHSQIVQLECLRSGFWGTKSTWGRVLTYEGA